jgi:hypothetical protein
MLFPHPLYAKNIFLGNSGDASIFLAGIFLCCRK